LTVISSTKSLLIVTAALELGGGFVLLIVPSLMAKLLLGTGLTSPESLVVGRVGGAALVAIGVSCWLERNSDADAPAVGLVAGVLVYNAVVAGLLLYAAAVGRMIGVGTWPAIVLHGALLVWCAACLRTNR
jgi:hypothetical protein